MKRISLGYFAQLRELAKCSQQTLETSHETLAPLYEELRGTYAFPFEGRQLRVAVNGAFAPWDHVLQEGDHVVFIPPVTGG